jgi:hypothetical protein
MDPSFKSADFQVEKRVREHLFMHNFCSMGSSRPPSRDTILLSLKKEFFCIIETKTIQSKKQKIPRKKMQALAIDGKIIDKDFI